MILAGWSPPRLAPAPLLPEAQKMLARPRRPGSNNSGRRLYPRRPPNHRCARRTVYSVARASSATPADSPAGAGSGGLTRIGNTTTAISSPKAKIPADHQKAVVYP
jgi:hypothetical protein